jgi:DNA replication and repair protein RecF
LALFHWSSFRLQTAIWLKEAGNKKKFMDSVISQLDSHYLKTYPVPKVMNQRNALLKYFALNHVLKMTLSPFTMSSSTRIHFRKRRVHWTIQTYFNTHHHAITGSEETVQLVYESHLFEKTFAALQENINKDAPYNTPVLAPIKTTCRLKSTDTH